MKRPEDMRCAVVLLLLLLRVPAAGAAEFDEAVGGYFQKHCIRCHGQDRQEGDFRIDTLSQDVAREDTPLWAEVRERISSGEMPPESVEDPPTADQGAAVVQWLSARISEGEAARMAKRDRLSFYRLSRDEYVHTIYDLLGVHFDAADPGGLSEDPQWHGFQRIGSVLSVSASHFEDYLEAAETVLDEAYPEQPSEPFQVLKPAVPPNTIREPYRSRLEAEELLDKVRFDLWPQDIHRYGKPGRVPAPGVYQARVKLSGLKPKDGPAPRLKVYHTKLDRVLYEQDVVAAEDEPTIVTFRTHLPAGHQQIQLINEVPGPSNLPRSGRHGRKPFVSIERGRIPWQLKLTDEQGNPLYPFLILDSVEWKGPVITDREKQLRADYMPSEPGDLDQVREGLATLARRAFRRPLRDGERDKYVDIVENEMAAGVDFHSAVKTGMLAILCSKSFLFIVDGSAEAERRTLNDWELATRLSYLLWSTMPDEELFRLAREGKLHEKQELRRQLARMLADPKARRFTESFPTQWLRLEDVGKFPPDEKLYPEYDHHLEQSMIGETTAFFREVLQRDLTLREFLDSDWTMLNARLASFYGIPGVDHDRFEQVSLQDEDRRGGLLTQASILSLTSDGTRHRPVHRGVWLSEAILGKSPPPPPANVDAIEPNPVDAPKATLRMKLEAHRQNPTCAACHRKIDPYGLAFENYNAIGSWRTREKVQRGTGEDPQVDASGELPDGRTFADAQQFKQLLLDDLDQFSVTFIEKLATYGLRRTITFEDQQQIAKIAEASKQDDYRLRAILEHFVTSELFQQR